MPPESSTLSSEVDALFYFIFYSALIFFLIVVGAGTLLIIKYRKKGKDRLTSGKDHNLKLELAWTIIPLILVFIVFVWGFQLYMKMNIVPRDAIEINVTAQKWFWTFTFDEGFNSINELLVPVDHPIKLVMSSKDVIHSFFVPDFRVKMDVVPNQYTVTWFEANKTGTFDLFCAEYCGTGHSTMLGKVKVVSMEEYQDWKSQQLQSLPEGGSLSEQGALLYKQKACITCHTNDGSAKIGPSFKGLYGRSQRMSDNSTVTADENYLRESILDPQAKVVAGFDPVMPTYQSLLNDRELDALISYIKSLNTEEEQGDSK